MLDFVNTTTVNNGIVYCIIAVLLASRLSRGFGLGLLAKQSIHLPYAVTRIEYQPHCKEHLNEGSLNERSSLYINPHV